jgi:hypothetical protein
MAVVCSFFWQVGQSGGASSLADAFMGSWMGMTTRFERKGK